MRLAPTNPPHSDTRTAITAYLQSETDSGAVELLCGLGSASACASADVVPAEPSVQVGAIVAAACDIGGSLAGAAVAPRCRADADDDAGPGDAGNGAQQTVDAAVEDLAL